MIIVGHNLTIPLPHISHSAQRAIKECVLVAVIGVICCHDHFTKIQLTKKLCTFIHFEEETREDIRKEIYNSYHSHRGFEKKKEAKIMGPCPRRIFTPTGFDHEAKEIFLIFPLLEYYDFLRH